MDTYRRMASGGAHAPSHTTFLVYTLSMLTDLLLLHVILTSLTPGKALRSLEHLREADLLVDFLHALKISLGGAFGTKDHILRWGNYHQLESL